ncbi:MAG: hypothetical protein JSW73_04510 [Candidatus Woesearchaeota archaeon]|nr:MAG: hypothetical protein JSW73_04510 [Candidatus Woesearchaeota archaeon]
MVIESKFKNVKGLTAEDIREGLKKIGIDKIVHEIIKEKNELPSHYNLNKLTKLYIDSELKNEAAYDKIEEYFGKPTGAISSQKESLSYKCKVNLKDIKNLKGSEQYKILEIEVNEQTNILLDGDFEYNKIKDK